MKSGANFQDQNKIRQLEAQGHGAEEIGNALQIDPRAVASFMTQQDLKVELPEGFDFDDEGNIVDGEGNVYEVNESDELVPAETE